MKKLIALIVVLIFMNGCITLKPKKSVCDDLTEPSRFCEIAEKYDISLEEIADIIEIGNLVAIKKDKYTANEALTSLKSIRNGLNYSVSYVFVQNVLLDLKARYPEYFLLSQILLKEELNMTQFMYKKDKDMLIYFIDRLISDMELIIKN